MHRNIAARKSLAGRIARITLCALWPALLPAAGALADDITSGTLTTKNNVISKVDGDKIYYKTSSGSDSSKVVADNLKINITSEPNLTPAEDAFIGGKFSDAVDGYLKVLRSTPTAWLKDYCALRLIKAGDKSERFDAVVTGYIHELAKDPKFAGELKINFPADSTNAYLKTAAGQVDAAIAAAKDNSIQTSLYVFRMNIAKAMKDDATVLSIAAKLSKSPGGTTGLDPAVLAGITEGKLNLIAAQVEKGDVAGAQKGLEEVKGSVVDPKQQAEWLWLTAETSAKAAGDTKNADTLKSLAIDYMRVVAAAPTSPRAAQALLKTGGILESLADYPAAKGLYTQITHDYDGQPPAAEAKKRLEKLPAK